MAEETGQELFCLMKLSWLTQKSNVCLEMATSFLCIMYILFLWRQGFPVALETVLEISRSGWPGTHKSVCFGFLSARIKDMYLYHPGPFLYFEAILP